MNKPPFTLPADPVDKHEVSWWNVQRHSLSVGETRAVYHVKATWEEIVPDDPGGEPFDAEWQVFWKGNFSGRAKGWCGFMSYDWSDVYPTRQEAIKALIAWVKEEIVDLAERRRDLEAALVTLRTELG